MRLQKEGREKAKYLESGFIWVSIVGCTSYLVVDCPFTVEKAICMLFTDAYATVHDVYS